jgi:hypothetical protein
MFALLASICPVASPPARPVPTTAILATTKEVASHVPAAITGRSPLKQDVSPSQDTMNRKELL